MFIIFFLENALISECVLIFERILNQKKQKTMKKITSTFLGLAIVTTLSLLSLNSCTKDPCKDTTCENSGAPTEDGDNCFCLCPTGYEGTTCGTLVRAKFIGTFNAAEVCGSGNDTYAIVVAAVGSDDKKVTVLNLYNAGLLINGEVNSDGGITIPSQTFGAGTISGSISATGAVSYSVSVGGAADNCTFTITL